MKFVANTRPNLGVAAPLIFLKIEVWENYIFEAFSRAHSWYCMRNAVKQSINKLSKMRGGRISPHELHLPSSAKEGGHFKLLTHHTKSNSIQELYRHLPLNKNKADEDQIHRTKLKVFCEQNRREIISVVKRPKSPPLANLIYLNHLKVKQEIHYIFTMYSQCAPTLILWTFADSFCIMMRYCQQAGLWKNE